MQYWRARLRRGSCSMRRAARTIWPPRLRGASWQNCASVSTSQRTNRSPEAAVERGSHSDALLLVSHRLLPASISGSCWLAAGLALSAADQVFFFSPELETGQDVHRLARQMVAPLPLHHPHLLFQALLQGEPALAHPEKASGDDRLTCFYCCPAPDRSL